MQSSVDMPGVKRSVGSLAALEQKQMKALQVAQKAYIVEAIDKDPECMTRVIAAISGKGQEKIAFAPACRHFGRTSQKTMDLTLAELVPD